MTREELQRRAEELLNSLSTGEKVDLWSMFRLRNANLSDLAYSPRLTRLCRDWTNLTGREWVESEMYHVLYLLLN